jgi:RimJ/RimL family protein N-acetyltransferase
VTFERLSWPRRTERLTIRPCEPADLRAIFETRSLPEVAQWMPSHPTSYEDFVLRQGRSGAMDRCLVLELDEKVVGDLYLHVDDAWAQAEVPDPAKGAQAEIGWSLSPAHQGNGYVTEAVTELVRLCFDELGVRRVIAIAFADNIPSLRVMDRLGMQREALHRQESLHRDLGWVDSVVYALLADDWRAGRGIADT